MTNPTIKLTEKIGHTSISFEAGHLAKQANGSAMAKLEDTVVLSACVQARNPRPEPADFIPLTVEYKERTYAAGKIPGGFFKREGRPREKEVLSSRLTDRSIRPLFPEHFNTETQLISMVLSVDGENDGDVVAINAASAALMISDIPFNGPVSAVRIGRIEGKFVVNPTFQQREQSDLELVISGTPRGIVMVEGGGTEVPGEVLEKAIEICKPEIDKICAMQIKMREKEGKRKTEVKVPEINPEIKKMVDEEAAEKIKNLLSSDLDKERMENGLAEITEMMLAKAVEKFPDVEKSAFQVKSLVKKIIYSESRKTVIEKKKRTDGRKYNEIRPIAIETGFLPRTHGSALFTRGQTQTIATVTLGTQQDMQIMDDLEGRTKERFLLHYNFPGFSTGEVRPERGPSRRDIGHGALAKRALKPLLPAEEEFPYTIRIVSDILESNGSSSMATVCGGSLSLFDAGVPMKEACSGIAMGLIKEGNDYAILSDITGFEDHFGDMDFKLTGTRKGITAFQMDVKLQEGIPIELLKKAIIQATEGRNYILDHMDKAIAGPKTEISRYAPQIIKLTVPKDKIGAIIGPGGKTIKGIIEKTGAEIEISDEGEEGRVFISSPDRDSLEAARKIIEGYSKEVEVGKIYKGRVVNIVDFGAFVEILPGKEGLLHISEIRKTRIRKVEDVLAEGDEVEVKVVNIENNGKFRLSRKALLK